MGVPVMIIGKSGSGKTTSLRNFDPGEVLILNVVNKPLPFRKKMTVIKNATYGVIGQALAKCQYKAYVIDDSQYLLANEMFDRAKETGYGKFTDMAVRFRNMITYIQNGIPDDIIVYMLHHSETAEDGSVKAKTLGKMLDNQLTVEGLFGIVIYCESDSEGHHFITQSNGTTTAKSPMELFDLKIDNDLKMVDTKIREYYDINQTTEEKKDDTETH